MLNKAIVFTSDIRLTLPCSAFRKMSVFGCILGVNEDISLSSIVILLLPQKSIFEKRWFGVPVYKCLVLLENPVARVGPFGGFMNSISNICTNKVSI